MWMTSSCMPGMSLSWTHWSTRIYSEDIGMSSRLETYGWIVAEQREGDPDWRDGVAKRQNSRYAGQLQVPGYPTGQCEQQEEMYATYIKTWKLFKMHTSHHLPASWETERERVRINKWQNHNPDWDFKYPHIHQEYGPLKTRHCGG